MAPEYDNSYTDGEWATLWALDVTEHDKYFNLNPTCRSQDVWGRFFVALIEPTKIMQIQLFREKVSKTNISAFDVINALEKGLSP